jgi:hypothetical protein
LGFARACFLESVFDGDFEELVSAAAFKRLLLRVPITGGVSIDFGDSILREVFLELFLVLHSSIHHLLQNGIATYMNTIFSKGAVNN